MKSIKCNSAILFIVGPPAVGKTTLVRELMKRLSPEQADLVIKPKWTKVDGVYCAVGHYSGMVFDGGDTVPYNGAAAGLRYWFDNFTGMPATIFDGDRFSTYNVLKEMERWAEKHSAIVRIVHLDAPAETLAARALERGSNQNAQWAKGRATKARNFALFDLNAIRLDATSSTSDMVDRLIAAVWPDGLPATLSRRGRK